MSAQYQFLAAPKRSHWPSEACPLAVNDTIISWNLSHEIKCLCCDTTAVNAGLRSGAGIQLEQKMEKHVVTILWK